LDISIRVTSDAGNPVVDSEPDGPHAAVYRKIAAGVRDQLQSVIAAA
jgi:ATP-binding protein involved in chromosome partitioning